MPGRRRYLGRRPAGSNDDRLGRTGRSAAIRDSDEADRVLAMSDLPRTALTFGSSAGIDEMATRVGQALNIAFELRESMYFGGNYFRSASALCEVIVQQNDDLGEPAEPAHPDLSTLVRIDVTAASEPKVVTALQPLGLIMVDRNA
jgi:hypothetical protein